MCSATQIKGRSPEIPTRTPHTVPVSGAAQLSIVSPLAAASVFARRFCTPSGAGGRAEDATQRLACPATTPCVAARCPAARCNLMQSHATPWRISAGHSPRAQPTSTAYEHSPRGGPGPQPQPPPRSRRATPPRSTPTTYTYHLHTYHLHTYHLQVHVRVVRVCVGASVAPSRPS